MRNNERARPADGRPAQIRTNYVRGCRNTLVTQSLDTPSRRANSARLGISPDANCWRHAAVLASRSARRFIFIAPESLRSRTSASGTTKPSPKVLGSDALRELKAIARRGRIAIADAEDMASEALASALARDRTLKGAALLKVARGLAAPVVKLAAPLEVVHAQ
jgi:hypothetical protein